MGSQSAAAILGLHTAPSTGDRKKSNIQVQSEHGVVQADRKVTQPSPDTCSVRQKVKHSELRRQKQYRI
jgi:hypothetical protein